MPTVVTRPYVYWIGVQEGSQHELKLKPTSNGTSYEGVGLSVSMHPSAWRQIARLSGDVNKLIRRDGAPGRFIVHTRTLSNSAGEWGLANGLLKKIKAWQVSWYDDEADDEMFMEFSSLTEAEEEAKYRDSEKPQEKASFVGTSKLVTRWSRWFHGSKFKKDLPQPWALIEATNMFVAVSHNQVDGLWWKERLEPNILSAPRGVILPHQLRNWKIGKSG